MMQPLKLFPNLRVISDPGTPSPGVHARRSAILTHMAPLKQLGRREYIDPAFLEELHLQRTDRIEARWIAAPLQEHQIVIDEHTLTPLDAFMKDHPELFGTASFRTTLELRETDSPLLLTSTSETIILGKGHVRFADRLYELSMGHPLHVPSACSFEVQAGGFVILFAPSPVMEEIHPLSPCPVAEIVVPTEHSEGPLHMLLDPQSFPTPAAAVAYFQISGVVEVWYGDVPVDVIYPGEERIFPVSPTPWELRPSSPETPLFFQF